VCLELTSTRESADKLPGDNDQPKVLLVSLIPFILTVTGCSKDQAGLCTDEDDPCADLDTTPDDTTPDEPTSVWFLDEDGMAMAL
jgi:hypothetical protein